MQGSSPTHPGGTSRAAPGFVTDAAPMSAYLAGTGWAVLMGALALWWGTATFRRENA